MPSSSPSITIAITAFNIADLLPRAIESAIEQTDPANEIVVVDDGSTDDISAAVKPYLQHIEYLSQENRGAAGAKNRAVEVATSEYVSLMDGDDYYLPTRIERIRSFIREKPEEALFTTDAFVEVDGRTIGSYYERANFTITDDPRESILRNNYVFGHAVVKRKTFAAFGGFDETMTNAEDRDLWTRMIFGGVTPFILDEGLSVYCRRDDSASRNRAAAYRGRARVFEKLLQSPDLSTWERRFASDAHTRQLAMARMIEASAAVEDGPRAIARSLSLKVLQDPACPRSSRSLAAVAVLSPGLARVGRRWFSLSWGS